MRFLRFLFLPGLGLLAAACEPALKPGPRVELVSSSRFQTSSRRLTTPSDTVATKVYAEASGSPLARLRITVNYEPVPEPVSYALPYEPQTRGYVYFDSDSSAYRGDNLTFQSVHASRTTAGREVWKYEVTDEEGRTGVRSFSLRLGRTDSAANYHSYTVPVQTPGAFGRRSFLALREGLVLPAFSLRNQPQNQQLIDLVYVPDPATGAPTLVTTTDAGLKLPWTGRAITIRSTPLTAAAFGTATTLDNFTTNFTQGQPFPRPTRTGPLTKGQVLAFRTAENNYGLLLVQDIITTGIRTLVLQVRMAK